MERRAALALCAAFQRAQVYVLRETTHNAMRNLSAQFTRCSTSGKRSLPAQTGVPGYRMGSRSIHTTTTQGNSAKHAHSRVAEDTHASGAKGGQEYNETTPSPNPNPYERIHHTQHTPNEQSQSRNTPPVDGTKDVPEISMDPPSRFRETRTTSSLSAVSRILSESESGGNESQEIRVDTSGLSPAGHLEAADIDASIDERLARSGVVLDDEFYQRTRDAIKDLQNKNMFKRKLKLFGELTYLDEEVVKEAERELGIKINRELCRVRKHVVYYLRSLADGSPTKYPVEKFKPGNVLKQLSKRPSSEHLQVLNEIRRTKKLPNPEDERYTLYRRIGYGQLMDLLERSETGDNPAPSSTLDSYISVAQNIVELFDEGQYDLLNYDVYKNLTVVERRQIGIRLYLIIENGSTGFTEWNVIKRAYKLESEDLLLKRKNLETINKVIHSIAKRFLSAIKKPNFDPIEFLGSSVKRHNCAHIPDTLENDMLFIKNFNLFGTSMTHLQRHFPESTQIYMTQVFWERIWPRYLMRKIPAHEVNEERDLEVVRECVESKRTIRELLLSKLPHRTFTWARKAIRKVRLQLLEDKYQNESPVTESIEVPKEESQPKTKKKYVFKYDLGALTPAMREELADVISRTRKRTLVDSHKIILAADMFHDFLNNGGDKKLAAANSARKHCIIAHKEEETNDPSKEYIMKTEDGNELFRLNLDPLFKYTMYGNSSLNLSRKINKQCSETPPVNCPPLNITIQDFKLNLTAIEGLFYRMLVQSKELWTPDRDLRLLIGVLRYGADFTRIRHEYFDENKFPDVAPQPDGIERIPMNKNLFDEECLEKRMITIRATESYMPITDLSEDQCTKIMLCNIDKDIKQVAEFKRKIRKLAQTGDIPVVDGHMRIPESVIEAANTSSTRNAREFSGENPFAKVEEVDSSMDENLDIDIAPIKPEEGEDSLNVRFWDNIFAEAEEEAKPPKKKSDLYDPNKISKMKQHFNLSDWKNEDEIYHYDYIDELDDILLRSPDLSYVTRAEFVSKRMARAKELSARLLKIKKLNKFMDQEEYYESLGIMKYVKVDPKKDPIKMPLQPINTKTVCEIYKRAGFLDKFVELVNEVSLTKIGVYSKLDEMPFRVQAKILLIGCTTRNDFFGMKMSYKYPVHSSILLERLLSYYSPDEMPTLPH